MQDQGAGDEGHRWTVTVVLLVALASLPTLAAVSAGSATLGQPAEPDGTTPFIAQPSDVPVVIVPQPPAVLPRPAGAGQGEPGRPRPQRPNRPAWQRDWPRHGDQHRHGDQRRDGRAGTGRWPGNRAGQPSSGATTASPSRCPDRAALGWRPLIRQTPRCPGGTRP